MINWQAALGQSGSVTPCLSTDPEPTTGIPLFALRARTDTGIVRMWMGADHGWVNNPFLTVSGGSVPTVTLTDLTTAVPIVGKDGDGNVWAIVSGGLVTNPQPLDPDIDGVTATIDATVGAGAVIGATTSEAAVTTDATGTNHQYLRGLVTILGAVAASPVVNSIGDRLKTLGTLLAGGLPAALSSLGGLKVDLVGAIQDTIDSIMVSGYRGTVTNRSGSITTGGTQQTLASSNSTRRYLFIQNIAAENLWINFTTTAVADQPSIKLVPGDSFVMEGSFISTELVSIIGATTGSKFVAKEG